MVLRRESKCIGGQERRHGMVTTRPHAEMDEANKTYRAKHLQGHCTHQDQDDGNRMVRLEVET